MATNEPKISFGVKAKPKTLLGISPASSVTLKAKESKERIEFLEGNLIKTSGKQEEQHATHLVIPPLKNERSTERMVKISTIQQVKQQHLQESGTSCSTYSMPNNGIETLEQKAVREIVEQTAEATIKQENSFGIVVPLKPEELPLDGARESNLDDYESVPIEQFGQGMLRGMGWTGDLKTDTEKATMGPNPRPKGLGLGADRSIKGGIGTGAVPLAHGEVLVMKCGAPVKIMGGRHTGKYATSSQSGVKNAVKMVLESKAVPSEEPVSVTESSPNAPIILETTEKANHVTEEPEKEPISPEPQISDRSELPQFFYTAMEQVAKDEGFNAGQYTVEVEDGSSKGDGFVGELFRAFLTEGDRREAYLCKIPPLNEARREQFGTMQSFEREAFVYNSLLPLMFAYQEEKGISREDGFFNTPRCYYAHYDGQTREAIIIMEDLRLKDCNMFNKDKPVDYEHARLTMELLGRYNAVSLAMKQDRPQEFEQFKVLDPMTGMMGPVNPFIMMLQKTAMDAIETLEPHETKERAKMQKLLDNIAADVARYDNFELAEPYAVLGHGDCWINNMMYRYRKGAPQQVILLDWQSARYSSPILDLTFFLLCCTDEELRRRHYDEMMNIYYNSLAALLEKLGHSPQQIFPRTAFLRQLRQYGRYGLMLAAFIVPMLCTRNEDILDMDATAEMFRDTQNVDIAIYTKNTNQTAYRKRMSAVIRDTVRYGYI